MEWTQRRLTRPNGQWSEAGIGQFAKGDPHLAKHISSQNSPLGSHQHVAREGERERERGREGERRRDMIDK